MTDPDGYRDAADFWWWVHAPPVVENPGPQRTEVDAIVDLQLKATDRDYVQWQFTGLPDGLSGSGQGRVTGSPTREGAFDVTATATDLDGTATSVTFTWTITAAGPPAPVPMLYGFMTGSDVQVLWFSAPGNPETIAGYEVTINPDGPTVTVDGETITTIIPDLDPAKEYTVSVVTLHRDGRRSTPTTAEVWK